MTANPLLNKIEDLIAYESIQANDITPALTELLNENKKLIQNLSQQKEVSWDNFIEPLEYHGSRLWRAWNVVNHLNSVKNTEDIRSAYNEVLPQITEYSTWISLNEDLFKQYLKLKKSDEFQTLSATRQRIINEAIKAFKLGGVELQGSKKETYAKLRDEMAVLTQSFALNTLDAMDEWVYYETDPQELEGLAEDFLNAAKKAATQDGQAGWKLTLQMPSYLPIMQYAKSSKLRERLYKGYATLASEQGNQQFDNSTNIENILKNRQLIAEILNFDHYAALQLQTRMAKSSEQVIDFLRDLANKAKPFAKKDKQELIQFAQSELGMNELMPWDYAYASEQMREKIYNYSDDQVRQYLPEEQVIKGLFSLIEDLYQIKFKAINASTWHPDAKVFEVLENNQVIGYLYTDLYARQGKQSGAWVANERDRHLYNNNLIVPVIYLNCNFTPPHDNKPTLLRHDDVITLFHEMGHALHGLLSKVDEPSASPFGSVEWDAIELPSQFMENFCFDWEVMQKISSHFETQEPLPKALFDKLYQAKNFQSGMQTVRQIEFALFDILLHQKEISPTIQEVLDLLNEVRQEVAVIIPPVWHRFPHNFSHIFAGGYAAGYYSYKWAEVLSADAFAYFEEHLKENKNSIINPKAGQHFKETILAVGGSKPAAEFFLDFRHREPSPEALLKHSGMSAEMLKEAH